MAIQPNAEGLYVAGVDLGGTNVRAVLTDRKGTKLKSARRPSLASGPGSGTVNQIVEAIQETLTDQGADASQLMGVGIGIPGIMDADEGILFWSPNFPNWSNREPIGASVGQKLGAPTFIINDARCAALGELGFGAGRGVKNMIMMTLGTGIGGGIVLDGKLMLGPQGSIGEIGHHTIDPNGPRCGCGNFGCMEALCGIGPIKERALRKIQSGRPTALLSLCGGDFSLIDPKMIGQAADSGDVLAQEVMDETGMYIGIGAANLINILNPERLVIGGGVALAGDTIMNPIRRTIYARAVARQRDACQLVLAELGDDAGVQGAVQLVLSKLPQ
ncbi:MAG TPA: ROK family protein [Armatimonadota bacterium]|jgi:glucokinase